MPTPNDTTTLALPGDSAPPRGCTHLRLRQFDRALTRHYDSYVSATGLKNSQYALLSHVVLLGPIGLGALARRLRLEPSTLTRNLQPLVAQGWLELLPGDDARSRKVGATPAGVALRTQAQAAWKQAQLALNERLGTARVAALHELLDMCMAALDPVGETDDTAA